MTPAGHTRLRAEVQLLKDERPKISRDIGTAREHGDLKENAEYHAAKERQGFIESRIKDLESALSRADVIDPSTLSGDKVRFGATVVLANAETEEQVTYQILGPYEADIERGSISVTAPLARALMGKEVGDEVTIKRPDGAQRVYEVLEVSFK
jgi:transcription elongation factor GreA